MWREHEQHKSYHGSMRLSHISVCEPMFSLRISKLLNENYFFIFTDILITFVSGRLFLFDIWRQLYYVCMDCG